MQLARVYALMAKERKLSNRELADFLRISEGSVRNALSYAKAAKLQQLRTERRR